MTTKPLPNPKANHEANPQANPPANHRQAWTEFWARNGKSGRRGGCLPSAWEGIDAAQRRVWTDFARRLPNKARVLDLATGDGRVMGWLLAARPDCTPIGVDMSPELPDPPTGSRVKTGIMMEDLPFPDAHFDAATSQFGFEYGDIAKAAAELARVVRHDGLIGIMTHRIDGPILEHNLRRREQIEWAIDDQDLIETAKRSLALRASGMMTTSPKLANAPAEGARLFGPNSAAWEIAEAIRRTMVGGAGHPIDHVTQTLETIGAQARNEIGRIASLNAACLTTADDAVFLAHIESSGLIQRDFNPVSEDGTTKPFGSFHILTKA